MESYQLHGVLMIPELLFLVQEMERHASLMQRMDIQFTSSKMGECFNLSNGVLSIKES